MGIKTRVTCSELSLRGFSFHHFLCTWFQKIRAAGMELVNRGIKQEHSDFYLSATSLLQRSGRIRTPEMPATDNAVHPLLKS